MSKSTKYEKLFRKWQNDPNLEQSYVEFLDKRRDEKKARKVKKYPSASDAFASLQATQRELVEALEKCSEWFDEYARMHFAKMSNQKAATNFAKRDYCRDAIAKIKGEEEND